MNLNRLNLNRCVAAVGATVLVATTLSSSWAQGPARTAAPALPSTFDPAQFSNPVANPYFPLEPGLVTRLHGTDDGEHFRERVQVTHRTKMVAGVLVTVVHDVARR